MSPDSNPLSLWLAGTVPNAAYLAIGSAALAWLRSSDRGAERLALAYLIGGGFASLAILALRALDLPISLTGLALVAAIAAALAWFARNSNPADPPVSPAAMPAWIRALDATTMGCAALLFASALGPEVGWDSLEYHLPLVQAWSEGPIRALPGVLDAEFRSGVDLLVLPAIAAGQADAAAATSACFAAALAALCRAEVSRRHGPAAGAFTGLLVLTTPLCLQAGVTSDVDLAVGAYGFTALVCADRWNKQGSQQQLVICALALAFAANAKLHAAILIPAVPLLLAFGGRVPGASLWLRAASLTSLLMLPWFVKIGLTTGNPLFPLFGSWLGTGPTSAEFLAGRRVTLLQDFPVPTGPIGFLRWLGFVIFGPIPPASGTLGLLPFALLPFGLRRASRSSAVLGALIVALLLLQFAFMRPVRFGVPIWALLSLGAAAGGVFLSRAHPLGRVAVSAALLVASAVGVGSLVRDAIPRIGAISHPDAYRSQVWPDQIALRELVDVAEPVVGISMGATLWMNKPVYNLHWERNGEFFFQGTQPARILELLKQRGVRSLVIAVPTPLPEDGRVGHPTVDAWLREGRARVPDVPPRAKRGGRVWVLVELL